MQGMFRTLFRQGAHPITEEDLSDLLKEMNDYITRRFSGSSLIAIGHVCAALADLAKKHPDIDTSLERPPFSVLGIPPPEWRRVEMVGIARARQALAYLLGFYGPGFSVVAFDLHREAWAEGIEERSRKFPALEPTAFARTLGIRLKPRLT